MHGTITAGSEIARRDTIEDIVAKRDRAIALFSDAYNSLLTTEAALDLARKAWAAASPGENRFNYVSAEEKAEFIAHLKVPVRDGYMATARRLIDTDVWSWVITMTDLERLMDKTAKDQFRQQLLNDPPESTVDNIMATLEQFMFDAKTIFQRGIAECFSKLDRRFRSHDGWKIGSRVIIDHAFDEYGHWGYRRAHQDTLIDIQRVFSMLDGDTPPAPYAGIVGAIDRARGDGWRARQTEVDSDFFKVRVYKNGNCHIWFKRDDLVVKVNKQLAEYYGEVIPEDRDADPDTGLNDPKTSLAKRFGFFPTPDKLAKAVVDCVPLHREKGELALSILEPSAGTGQLARLCAAEQTASEWDHRNRTKYSYRHAVDCVEIQPALADMLRDDGLYRKVYCCDFLAMQPNLDALYDRVVTNPPHDRERDIDHVMHALKFLKPDGCLVAIMSAGTEFRETRKATAFRELIAKMGGIWKDLPTGSFSEVGTNVNTILMRVWKNGTNVGGGRIWW